MSIETKSTSGIWGALGKAGVIVGLIWGGIQIYNYFFKLEDFEAEANGRHSYYKTVPVVLDGFEENIENKAIVKTIIDADGTLKNYNYKKLKNAIDKDYRFISYSKNYSEINPIKGYDWNGDYNAIWSFKIKNIGSKPLEELALEVPFKGHYKVKFPDNTIKIDSFSNKINLKELRPSYEISIICWTNTETYYPESDEEKSRFTHKNGWFSISYPVETSGIYAFNERYHGTPLFIFFVIIFFLFIIIYAAGEAKGVEKQKKSEPESKSIELDKNE